MHKIIALALALTSLFLVYYMKNINYITDGNYIAEGNIVTNKHNLSFKKMVSIYDGDISYHYTLKGKDCDYTAELYALGGIERYGESTIEVSFTDKNLQTSGNCTTKFGQMILDNNNQTIEMKVLVNRDNSFCIDTKVGSITCYRKLK